MERLSAPKSPSGLYRIFLSSTDIDLHDYRTKLLDAMRLMGDVAPIDMRYFGAQARRSATEASLEEEDDADLVILLIAWRYGTIPRDATLSITHQEYRHAIAKGIPILVYLAAQKTEHDEQLFPLADRNEEHSEQLRAFRGEVQVGRIVGYFDNPADLGIAVVAKLHQLLGTRPHDERGGLSPARRREVEEESYLQRLINFFQQDIPFDVSSYTAVDGEVDIEARQVNRFSQSVNDEFGEGLGGRAVDALEFLLDDRNRAIMIKGEPGTGKTLLLHKFGLEMAQRARARKRQRKLPIYVSLNRYVGTLPNGKPEEFFDFLYQYLKEQFPFHGFLREQLWEYFKSDRVILLLDGLNEMPPDEYVERLDRIERFVLSPGVRCKTVITCRTLKHTSDRFKTITLNELSPRQIRQFIRNFFSNRDDVDRNDADRLADELLNHSGYLLKVCRRPYMLRMLLLRGSPTILPASAAKIFEDYAFRQIQKIDDHAAQAVAHELRSVAWYAQVNGVFAGTIDLSQIELPAWLENQEDLRRHLTIAHQAKLIDFSEDRYMSFNHQVLQEYFAATVLREIWQGEGTSSSIFADARWEETIILCAGLMESPEPFLKTIWSPDKEYAPERFFLSVKALGSCDIAEISRGYYDDIIQQASFYLGLNRDYVAPSETRYVMEALGSLAMVGNRRAYDLIQRALYRNSSSKLRSGMIHKYAFNLLASSRDPDAKELLDKYLADNRSIANLGQIRVFTSADQFILQTVLTLISPDNLASVAGRLLQFLYFLAPIPLLIVSAYAASALRMSLDRFIAMSFAVIYVPYFVYLLIKSIARRYRWGILLSLVFIAILVGWIAFPVTVPYIFNIGLAILFYYFTGVLFLFTLFTLRKPVELIYGLQRSFGFFVLGASFGFNILGIIYEVESRTFTASLPKTLPVEHLSVVDVLALVANGYVYVPMYYLRWPFTVLSIVVIFIYFWLLIQRVRLQRWRVAFVRRGNSAALNRIFTVIEDERAWIQIRQMALRMLRSVRSLPAQYLQRLEAMSTEDDRIDNEINALIYAQKGRLPEQSEQIARLERLVAKYPDNDEYWDEYGSKLVDAKRAHDAVGAFSKAIALNGNSYKYWNDRGIAYSLLRDWPAALDALQTAKVAAPREERGAIERDICEALLRLLRYDEALVTIGESMKIEKLYRTIVIQAEVLDGLGRHEEAHKVFEQAIKRKSQTPFEWLMRGRALIGLGQYEEAISAIDRGFAYDISDIVAWELRARALDGVGRTDDAQKARLRAQSIYS